MRFTLMKYVFLPLVAMLALPLAACSRSEPIDSSDIDRTENAIDIVNEVEGNMAAATNETLAMPHPANANIHTPAGLGAIGIGKPPAVAGADALQEEEVQLSDSCRMLQSKDYPRIYVMSDGTDVRRITVMDRSDVKTAKGISIGATEAEVRRAYPDLREEAHKYVDAPAKNLYYEPGGKDAPALRFEFDGDGRVDLIHAGLQPQLSYVEGCA